MVLVDIHCHILPGIDDGAKDWMTSMKLAREAVQNGVTHAVVTPHTLNGKYLNHKKDVIRLTENFQEMLDEAHLPLTVFPGMEVRINNKLLEAIANDDILFCDEEGKYMLLEFPSNDVPSFSSSIVYELLREEITPVIVHPERNTKIMQNPELLQGFLEQGCLVQITASSYTGIFGSKVEKFARQLIKAGQGCTFASDAHDLPNRQYQLSEAYDKLSHEFGEELAQTWKDNARDLINGEPVEMRWHPLKQGKFFGLF
ncbi:tyrosine-protein phosphatase [Lactobacillus mulieris]|uniref:Tyrosine-protein phosphatase n=1 Tax=Lactobacillus mulieris TaxID=2508708 RepID=A0AAW5WY42_9LACO|nr:CpsB/CapC family capsule biosynthesis tyrosine phosphatase [Lactobacillus mulieris]MCZ3622335.1 exopolysaccharide biosynthesis protein [Lactobacillus mulieris]MCZ3622965.1 exopolysaccharide biosynthesis protein [Lactobacillus mulieris]MCZ3636342.1 exopolysaccharide biosynthesis protein [Lactobacillus mulieris]MCZ3690710.1 exopolysaccharide biosynthesis protein [Lactobacillus mulieris]MCZ3696668.1 exopolysaccharide biosynthesis protein [Lactobacillus mulieris]